MSRLESESVDFIFSRVCREEEARGDVENSSEVRVFLQPVIYPQMVFISIDVGFSVLERLYVNLVQFEAVA